MKLSKEQQQFYDILTNEGQTIQSIIEKAFGVSKERQEKEIGVFGCASITLTQLQIMGLASMSNGLYSKIPSKPNTKKVEAKRKSDPDTIVNDDTVATNYNLDAQFAFYLKKVNLDPKAISQTQLVETKRAFFGACGQMLMLMGNLGTMSENDAYDTTHDLLEQVGKFWERQ